MGRHWVSLRFWNGMWMERNSLLLATILVDLESGLHDSGIQHKPSCMQKGDNHDIPRDIGTKCGYAARKECVPCTNTCLPDTCNKV